MGFFDHQSYDFSGGVWILRDRNIHSTWNIQWFCPHTLGIYLRLPQTTTIRKKFPNFRNCWWRVLLAHLPGGPWYVGEILETYFVLNSWSSSRGLIQWKQSWQFGICWYKKPRENHVLNPCPSLSLFLVMSVGHTMEVESYKLITFERLHD